MLGQVLLNSLSVSVVKSLWGTGGLGPYYQIVICHSHGPESERPLQKAGRNQHMVCRNSFREAVQVEVRWQMPCLEDVSNRG